MDLMMKWRTFIYLFRIAVHFEFDACKKTQIKLGLRQSFHCVASDLLLTTFCKCFGNRGHKFV